MTLIIDLGEEQLCKFCRWLRHELHVLWLKACGRFEKPAVTGFFNPWFTFNDGVLMAGVTPPLQVNTPYTSQLTFLDANGNPASPPTGGTITSSDPSVTVGLSTTTSPGGFANAIMTAPNVSATLTYTAGSVTFQTVISDTPLPAASGSFGPWVAGTTA